MNLKYQEQNEFNNLDELQNLISSSLNSLDAGMVVVRTASNDDNKNNQNDEIIHL